MTLVCAPITRPRNDRNRSLPTMRFASRTIGEKMPFFAPPIKTAAWTGGARRLGAVTPRLGRGAKADAAETAQSARRRVRAISGMCWRSSVIYVARSRLLEADASVAWLD